MVSRKRGTLFITHCNCYYFFVLFLKMCYVVCYIFGYIVNTLKFKNKKMQQNQIFTLFVLVPRRGLEPPRLAAQIPETCASTNSAIWALRSI